METEKKYEEEQKLSDQNNKLQMNEFVASEVKFILGTQNMIKAGLSEELLKMHRFVVGDTLDEGFLKRWLDNEKNTGPRYISYIANKNGQMASMISGTINTNGDMYVMNTATLPDLRQKGYLKMLLASLYLVCGDKEMNAKLKQLYGADFTNIQKIFALFNGPSKTSFKLSESLIDKINIEAQKIIEITDSEAIEYSKMSPSFGKVAQAMVNLNNDNNVDANLLTNFQDFFNILQKKFCFKNKIFQSLEKDIQFNPSICHGASTVNYIPNVDNNGQLNQYSQQVQGQFEAKRKNSFDAQNQNPLGTNTVNDTILQQQ